jgi:uncharacterized protein (TIGR02145 family)
MQADYEWTFGEDASPKTSSKHANMSSDPVTYTTAGRKTATLKFIVSEVTTTITCSELTVVDDSQSSSSEESSSSSVYGSDISCYPNDMWCKDQWNRVNTGVDAGQDNGGYWWATTDNSSGGQSVIEWPVPRGTDFSSDAFDPIIDYCNGFCGTYNLEMGSLDEPWVLVGFSIAGYSETSSDNVPADVSGWGGICINYTSDIPVKVELHFDSDLEQALKYDLPFVKLPKKFTETDADTCIAWSKFAQGGWGVTDKGGIAISTEEAVKYVKDIGFMFQAKTGTTGYFNIFRLSAMNGGGAVLSTWGYLNGEMTYGLMQDDRDGQLYRTIEIGENTWMAQNLNYVPRDTISFINADSSNQLGRLYTWEIAQNVCPDGWHLPSSVEFSKLISMAGGQNSAAKNLMATTGWHLSGAANTVGFSALPAGMFDSHYEKYDGIGVFAGFWSSINGYGIGIDEEQSPNYLIMGSNNPDYANSVRCVKDE